MKLQPDVVTVTHIRLRIEAVGMIALRRSDKGEIAAKGHADGFS